MHGLPVTPDGYDEFTKAQLLHLQRQIPSHGFEAEQVARCLKKFEALETSQHREAMESGVAAFNARLEAINTEVGRIKEKQSEPPKSEWRTWSLWVAVIALSWQIGEKIPWSSLLPSPALPSAGSNPKTTLAAPVQAADNLPGAHNVPTTSVETSKESKRATEPPAQPNPAEHPKD